MQVLTVDLLEHLAMRPHQDLSYPEREILPPSILPKILKASFEAFGIFAATNGENFPLLTDSTNKFINYSNPIP